MISEELEEQPTSAHKKTVELCADQHDGAFCTLRKGHPGHHESHTLNGARVLTWE